MPACPDVPTKIPALMQGHAREVAKLKASSASGRIQVNGTTGSPRSKHPSAWTAMQKEHQTALTKAISNAQVCPHTIECYISSIV